MKIDSYSELSKMLDGKKKISILGAGGSGKSTLAKRLSNDLKLPLIGLDQVFWHENWEPMDASDFESFQKDALKKENIIIEGTYEEHLSPRLNMCDVVIMVRCNPILCLWRVIFRSFQNRGKEREGIAKGCIETFSFEYIKFLLWIINFSKVRKQIEEQCRKRTNILYIEYII